MGKPKFYLDTAISAKGTQAIKMLYSFNGQRLKYHTQISVLESYFQPECNSTNKKPINKNASYGEQFNNKLEEIALDAVIIVTSTKGDKLTVAYVREQLDLIHKPKAPEPEPEPEIKHTLTSYFEQFIENCKSGKRVIMTGKNRGKRYTRNALKNYGITLSALNRYMTYYNIKTIPFDIVDKDFYEAFRFYCFNIEQKEVSTFGGYIKDIKTLMGECKPANYVANDYIIPNYESDTIYLDDFQIEKIINLDLSDDNKFITYQSVARDKDGKAILTKSGQRTFNTKKISYQTLDKARNLALIGFFSGLRFSDFSTLEPKNIEGKFIKLRQTKTGAWVTIPIMEKLKPVLAKYPNGVPSLTNQRFNDYFKEVAKLAGLTELIEISNFKGGIENKDKYPLYSLLSSHTCRRSYATNMFNKGIPPMLIMSATGHKTESSFLKYIRTTDEQKANLYADLLETKGL